MKTQSCYCYKIYSQSSTKQHPNKLTGFDWKCFFLWSVALYTDRFSLSPNNTLLLALWNMYVLKNYTLRKWRTSMFGFSDDKKCTCIALNGLRLFINGFSIYFQEAVEWCNILSWRHFTHDNNGLNGTPPKHICCSPLGLCTNMLACAKDRETIRQTYRFILLNSCELCTKKSIEKKIY